MPRTDDGFEPNNDLEHATLLGLDTPITARANQDDPDIFVVDVSAGGTLVLLVESLGLEECAGFTVSAPDGSILFRTVAGCDAKLDPVERAPGIEVEHTRERLMLAIPVALSGRYALTVLEGGETDNLLDFSWDYRVTCSRR